MCTPEEFCPCFHAGAEDVADSVITWARGDHGTACRCERCEMAILLIARGLPGLAHLLRTILQEPKAPPPPPSDTMDAGTGDDF